MKKHIGYIISGSLSDGLVIRINHNVALEHIVSGKFIVIDGTRYKFFCLVTNLKLEVSIPDIILFPPAEHERLLLKTIKQKNPDLIIVLICNHIHEAIKLYEQGADYVILPHYIGIDHTSLMLEEYGFDIQKFMENKVGLIHDLKNRHQDLMIEMLQK